jgi:hypothetical protein
MNNMNKRWKYCNAPNQREGEKRGHESTRTTRSTHELIIYLAHLMERVGDRLDVGRVQAFQEGLHLRVFAV